MKIDDTIFLDHQATTPMDSRVLAEMTPYLTDRFGNPHSADHSVGWKSAQVLENASERVSRLLGVELDEVVFTSGATESNNLALLGLGRRASGSKRRRILLSAIEHKCVLAAGRVLSRQHGYTIELIPVDAEGFVDVAALELMLDEDVLAVSVMAVNNEIGTIQPLSVVSDIVRGYGAVLHCDAAQAPVTMNLDELSLQADLISLSAHKMYGPMGIGALVVPYHVHDRVEPLIHGGGQQHGLRSGTVPVPLCVGMAAAADLLVGAAADEKREILRHKRDDFVEKLSGLGWPVEINGPDGALRHIGNANVRFSGFAAHDILTSLQPRLAASTGSACTSGTPEPSHVLRAIGLPEDQAESSIRFSLGFGTTDEDVDEAIGLVSEALTKLSEAGLARSA